jgi:O-antigen/teichoic acid export membrane protein
MSQPGEPRSAGSRIPLAELAGGGGLTFLVAYAIVGLSTFVFHVVVSRLLGPDRYGALGALLTVLLVLSVPLTGIQAAVTRAVALRGDEPASVRQVTVKGTMVGVVGMLILGALSPLMADFLHLGSPVPVLMLAIFLPPTAGAAVLQGVLIGRLRFTPVAVALLVGAGARLLFGAVLVEAGLGVTGAMLASTLGAVVTFAIVAWTLRASFGPASPLASRVVPAGEGAPILIAVAGYWVLAGADTFLVRHLLDAHQAGLYAAAATGSRIALFAPAAFVMLVFPRFAASRGRGPQARLLLIQSTGVVVLMGILVAGTIVLLPGALVHILFGSGFTGSASTVGLLATEAAVLGVIGLFTYFHLARGSAFAQLSWLGAGVAVVGVSLFHHTMSEVADVMLVTSVIVLAISVAGVLWSSDAIEQPEVGSGVSDALPDGCDLSFIVPFYNPGARFGPHLKAVIDVLDTTGKSFEVIAVSDGSTDGSQLAVASQGDERVRLISLPDNQGKGTALRVGMAEAQGTYVGFIDADGDLPARLIPGLIALTESTNPDVVLGSKRHPDSEVIYPPLRHLYSIVYQVMTGLLFHLPVRDSQTGLKLIRRETMLAVVPRMVEKRFAFDLELLVVARHLGYRRFVEAPVVIEQRFTSTISPRAVRGMIQDTLAIFYRLRILRFYDQTPSSPPQSVHQLQEQSI